MKASRSQVYLPLADHTSTDMQRGIGSDKSMYIAVCMCMSGEPLGCVASLGCRSKVFYSPPVIWKLCESLPDLICVLLLAEDGDDDNTSNGNI